MLRERGAMITGERPSKCELADECRFDPNCPVWLACITNDQRESEPEPATEDVIVSDDRL